MRIFVSAGEPSGDHHGADLIEAIRRRVPDTEFVGFGGDRMKAAGATLLFPLVDLAIMWFTRVLLNIRKFFRLLDQADASFRDQRPDAVVLIDYPGFHWHVARKAKARGIPVIYYVPPQIWAWAGWRIKKVKRSVDQVLCSLPFEPAWYAEHGFSNAEYVGHPFFDELGERPVDQAFLDAERSRATPLVVILPGSRTQEVSQNLPILLRAAAQLASGGRDVRFAVACLHERHQALAESILTSEGLTDLPLVFHAAKTPELIRVAKLAWAVSGSVSLELMMEALPTVVLYKVKRFGMFLAYLFKKAKYITLVNLLADAEVMPEYLTRFDVSSDLANWGAKWLDDPTERAKASQALAELREKVAQPGASERAAERILATIAGASKPHVYAGPRARASSILSINEDTGASRS